MGRSRPPNFLHFSKLILAILRSREFGWTGAELLFISSANHLDVEAGIIVYVSCQVISFVRRRQRYSEPNMSPNH